MQRVTTSEYAPFGQIIDDRPGRPDPTPTERDSARRADRVGYRALLAERRWTPEQFETAKLYAFPRPVTQLLSRDGSAEAIYSRRAVDEWAAALKQFAKTVK